MSKRWFPIMTAGVKTSNILRNNSLQWPYLFINSNWNGQQLTETNFLHEMMWFRNIGKQIGYATKKEKKTELLPKRKTVFAWMNLNNNK